MNITRGKKPGAIRVGIYGTEGVGKTTFAAKFPRVVFIDTEGSTKHMDVARFDPPQKLQDVIDCVKYAAQHPEQIGTVAIDTVDWLEKLLLKKVCEEKHVDSIEDIAYGKGYVFAKGHLQALLEELDKCIAAGINVVLVCHSMIRKFELPDEMGSYDRYMLKLNEKNIAPLIKEWVDVLLFVNYRTDILKAPDGKTMKGRGGQKRIMYANHNACWDAKNRFGLPDEMPFEFEQIQHLFTDTFPEPVQETSVPEPEAPSVIITPPQATVTKGETLPPVEETPVPIKPQKSGKKANPAERPESMQSDNPDKDKLLTKLWSNMCGANVPDPNCLQAVVSEKGYYDLNVPVKDYDIDFIEGCLLEAWDQVRGLCQTQYNNLPF